MTPLAVTAIDHHHHHGSALVSRDYGPGTVLLSIVQTGFRYSLPTLWGPAVDDLVTYPVSILCLPRWLSPAWVSHQPLPCTTTRGLSSQARWAHMLPWRLFACRHVTQFWPRRCEHRSVDGPLGKGLRVLRDARGGKVPFPSTLRSLVPVLGTAAAILQM